MELLNCGRNKAVKSLQAWDDEKGIGLIPKAQTGLWKGYDHLCKIIYSGEM